MSRTGQLPCAVDESVPSADVNSQWDGLLGERFSDGQNTYRLVEAGAAISSAAGKVLKWTSRAANTVEASAAGADYVAGVVPQGMGDIASADYFLVIIDGDVEYVGGDTITAGNFLQGGATTAGRADDSGATEASTDWAVAVDANTAGNTATARILRELF